ncbi:MAG TPA: hypothetical protein VM370_07280 [Candidatus Thermoplasmatota archaeon]|nr:hypothetical protein [Candidatus Thermoplasmatota archaeon]
MTDHTRFRRSFVIAALACALLVAAPAAVAQDWQGQDSEFGSIRAPYTATMDGDRVPVEARVVLRENYEEKDSRFFMFGFTVENTPLDVKFDSLIRMDTGEEMHCYQREGTADTAIKCFVDLKDMPKPGTEIRMQGSVGAKRTGTFQVGAIVVPFTYTWTRVQMSNGLNAELYAGTQLAVQKATGGGSTRLSGDGKFAKVPGIGPIAIVGAAGIAAALLAGSKRRK